MLPTHTDVHAHAHIHTRTHLHSPDTLQHTCVGGRLHMQRLHIFALEVCVSVSLSMGLSSSSSSSPSSLFCVLLFSTGIIQSLIDGDAMRQSRLQSALSRHLGITKDKGGGLRDILKSFNFNRSRFPRKQHHNNDAGTTANFLIFFSHPEFRGRR